MVTGPMAEMLVVREFDVERDISAVEEMERRCDVGPSGKTSIYTDCMGDPICRIRHSPAYLMLVRTHFYSKIANLHRSRMVVKGTQKC